MSLARAAKVVQRSVIPTLTRGFATKVAIVPKDAPAAVGPYSHGIEAHGMIFVSGQLPIDPKTSQFVSDTDAGQQTAQCLRNMESVLKAADADLTNVVKTTILLADMSDFAKVNEVYSTFFKPPYPARATFAVKGLPKGALVEIEGIAVKGN